MDFRGKVPTLSARYISATQRPRTSFAWIYAIRSLVVFVLLIAGAGIGHAQCPPSSSGSGNTGDVLYNNGTSTGCNNSSVTIDSTGKNVTVPGTLTFLNSSNKNAYANLSFSNFAALKAFDPTSLGSNMVSATTAGYSAPGDGGGSTYDWVASPPSNIVTDIYFYVISRQGRLVYGFFVWMPAACIRSRPAPNATRPRLRPQRPRRPQRTTVLHSIISLLFLPMLFRRFTLRGLH